jgi:hypothetical protein
LRRARFRDREACFEDGGSGTLPLFMPASHVPVGPKGSPSYSCDECAKVRGCWWVKSFYVTSDVL